MVSQQGGGGGGLGNYVSPKGTPTYAQLRAATPFTGTNPGKVLSKNGSNVIQNPAFDARLTPSGATDAQGKFMAARSELYRGRLESVPTKGYVNDSAIYQLRFLWNPTSVNHTSAVDAQYLPQQVTVDDPNARGDASPFMQISQNVSFSLLFDRTYETWSYNEYKYTSKWGVLADIKVLYAMLGMFNNTEVGDGGDGKTTVKVGTSSVEPEAVMQMTPQSAHMMVPMWAIFGPLLKYYGFITAFSIDYTHFTQRMVPNRAAVQMSMQLVPKTFTQQRSASQREADTARGYIGNPHGTGTYHNRKNV